ncbi:hypothetical protein J4Q44_G00053860 [Coregonus suidteri]|uniref:MYND-type domain-containing protein n=1 Tax=Coregonus suidteri TaxID=861788 RepID=A0AAN8RD91_9TELE
MELVSSHRDRMIEFSEAMAQWYRCFQTTHMGRKEAHCDFWGYDFPRYPMDRSPYWILHLMDCAAPPPAAIPRLEQAGVDPSELMSSDGESVLMVTDASGLPLGFDVLAGGWAGSLGGGEAAGGDGKGALETIQRMVGLLRRCMEAPMSGGLPRRPRMLHVNDKKLHRLLSRCEKALTILKMVLWPQALVDWGLTEVEQADGGESFSMRWPPTCYCHVCKKHSFPSQLKPCSQCKAVLYCSDQCSQTDQIRCPEDASHQHWCEKLACYMSHHSQLADLPFSYAAEVTADDFDLEHFLNKNKLDSGYWVHWSLLVRSPRYELHPTVEQSRGPYPHWFTGHSEPFGPLKKEGDILLCSPAPHAVPRITKPLVLWCQYCEWRGISLSSPAAVLLSSPLSIYYIITSLVPRDFPELNILKKQSLKIHIIDSYREFHTLMVFWELSILLPHITFELVFIGEGLPPESDEEQLFLQKKDGCVNLVNPSFTPDEKLDRRSIRVKGYRRAYHMLQGPKPDLVIGFRPAIQLQESWLSTLPRLQVTHTPPPFLPTYYCLLKQLQHSLTCETAVLQYCKEEPTSVTTVSLSCECCSRYSNAFIFHLMYKPLHSDKRPSVAYPKAPPLQVEPANQEPEYPVKMSRRDRKQAAHNMPRKRK